MKPRYRVEIDVSDDHWTLWKLIRLADVPELHGDARYYWRPDRQVAAFRTRAKATDYPWQIRFLDWLGLVESVDPPSDIAQRVMERIAAENYTRPADMP